MAGASTGPCSQPLGPAPPSPITVSIVQGYSPPRSTRDDPNSSHSPRDCCLQPRPPSRGRVPNPGLGIQGPHLPALVQQIFMQTARDHPLVCGFRYAACPVSLSSFVCKMRVLLVTT